MALENSIVCTVGGCAAITNQATCTGAAQGALFGCGWCNRCDTLQNCRSASAAADADDAPAISATTTRIPVNGDADDGATPVSTDPGEGVVIVQTTLSHTTINKASQNAGVPAWVIAVIVVVAGAAACCARWCGSSSNARACAVLIVVLICLVIFFLVRRQDDEEGE
jgi:hypothetical protein